MTGSLPPFIPWILGAVIFVVFMGLLVVVILKRYRSVYRIRRIRRDIRLGSQLGFPMSRYPDHSFSFSRSRRRQTVDIGENVRRSNNGIVYGCDNQNQNPDWKNPATASLQPTGASRTQEMGVGPVHLNNDGESVDTSDPDGFNRQWDSLARRVNNNSERQFIQYSPSNPPPIPGRNRPFCAKLRPNEGIETPIVHSQQNPFSM